MPQDMLQTGAAWLSQKMRDHAAQDVLIRVGPTTVVAARATIGSSRFEIPDHAGVMTSVEVRDYLIDVDAYPDDAPQSGHRIIEGSLADGRVFEVAPPGFDEPCWRYSDAYRLVYRIHTKFVGTTPPPP